MSKFISIETSLRDAILQQSGKRVALFILLLFWCGALTGQTQPGSSPIFDYTIRDDSSGNVIRFDSLTGAYRFIAIGTNSGRGPLTIDGVGNVTTHGCVVRLVDFSGDRRVNLTINTHTIVGTAYIQIFSLGFNDNLTDRGLCCRPLPPPGPSPSASPTAVIIPLYVFPATSSCALDPAWQRLIDAKVKADAAGPPIEVWAVVNPNSGPKPTDCDGMTDTLAIDAYKFGIAQLHAANIKVLGYVCTKYADASEITPCGCARGPGCVIPDCDTDVTTRDVVSNINDWYNLYNSADTCGDPAIKTVPDGVFFDEMAQQDGTSPDPIYQRSEYYSFLSNCAKGFGFTFTVGNAGRIEDKLNLEKFASAVDTIMIYEKAGFPSSPDNVSYGDLDTIAADHTSDYSKWGIIPYGVADPSSISAPDLTNARASIKYIYVTNGTGEARWHSVPDSSYLDTLFRRLAGM